VVALIKLRRRDLSAILEGSGWAINARMRLTRRQSRFFTQRPSYPLGAKGTPRRRWWILVLVVLAVVLAVLALHRGCYGPRQEKPVSQSSEPQQP